MLPGSPVPATIRLREYTLSRGTRLACLPPVAKSASSVGCNPVSSIASARVAVCSRFVASQGPARGKERRSWVEAGALADQISLPRPRLRPTTYHNIKLDRNHTGRLHSVLWCHATYAGYRCRHIVRTMFWAIRAAHIWSRDFTVLNLRVRTYIPSRPPSTSSYDHLSRQPPASLTSLLP
jgi:hypothetical protein